ncbi:MAG: GAF domain-containing protein [candidate division Zixibacteria bacterium]|nr:GAF domain-containing protein [candidate division Zixibacteria bacterium]
MRSIGRIAQKLNSFLNVPLMNDGNIVGMINVSSHRDRFFSPDDIRLIYTIVSQVPSATQRLNEIRAAERSRMDKLAEGILEGAIIIDENFEVVLVNGITRKILRIENSDVETIQNTLGLDLKRFKAPSEKGTLDLVAKEVNIYSETYEITASIIRGTAAVFMGFVISIRKSTKRIQD